MMFIESYKIDKSDAERTDLLSATITFVKFPLAVLVVILHANILTKPVENIGITVDLASEYPVFAAVTWILSRFLAYLAVPSFFVISGFLLFYNVERLDISTYRSKLQRRIHTLIIPYIVWNIIYFVVLWIIDPKNLPLFTIYDVYHEWNPIRLLYEVFVRPLDGPLWFIRNLFAMVIISPLFYWAARKVGLLVPLLLLCTTQFAGNSIIESLLWFSMGVSLSVMRIDFLRLCRDLVRWCGVILAIGCIVDIYVFANTGTHSVIGYFTIFKIMLVFALGYWMIQKHRSWANNRILNNSTFMIYAYHGAPQCWLLGLLLPVGLNYGEGGAIMAYVVTFILIVIVGVVISIPIHKSKMLSKILTGRQ